MDLLPAKVHIFYQLAAFFLPSNAKSALPSSSSQTPHQYTLPSTATTQHETKSYRTKRKLLYLQLFKK
jgi:hypothetical protein